jgi:UDP-glucose 4-epimerase
LDTKLKILVTGGAGYIGSHFVNLLKKLKIDCVVLDNLKRGHKEAVPPDIDLEIADLLNYDDLQNVFSKFNIDSVVHFAAFAYVGESVDNPIMYYQNNVVGSLNLIRAAVEASVENFVFSSTCSLYGNPDRMPISEDCITNPINPYAQTKLIIERMLADIEHSNGMRSVCLRYFNAAGADFLGNIGESHDPEPHLIPIVLNTALGKREKVFIFGDDYETNDGTCIRDYIHVNDLAAAHLKALNYLKDGKESQIVNLGTGNGNSVMELIKTAEKIAQVKIPFEITGRRTGDPAVLVADNEKARRILDWEPEYDLDHILSSALNWHRNPKF